MANIIPVPLPFIFSNGVNTDATQVNADLNTIVTNVNAMQTIGTWTPTDLSGDGMTFLSMSCSYTQIANMVFAQAVFQWPTNSSASVNKIGGFPFNCSSSGASRGCGFVVIPQAGVGGGPVSLVMLPGTNQAQFFNQSAGYVPNSYLSGQFVEFSAIYPQT